jgi:hypothetical protein
MNKELDRIRLVSEAVAALSARVMALEALLYSLSTDPKIDAKKLSERFEAFAGAMEAQALNQPSEDRNIELLQVSIQDIREHLAELGS